jgi:RHS repeat-associated protein
VVHCSRRRSLGTLLALVMLIALTAFLVFVGQARAGEPAASPSPTVVREVIEKRAVYSNTYLLSNGQYRCVSYGSPVNYRAADGSWQPVDTTLMPEGSLSVYATRATPVKVSIADEGPGQKPVTVSDGTWTVTMNLVDWAEDEKLVIGDAAVFTGVAPETDVAYTVLGDGIKEVITLASPAAPNTFTYRLTHSGLELRQDAEGGWGLYEPGAKKTVFVVGSMSACDSSRDAIDEPAWCEGAAMTVVPGKGASTITYYVPREWMNDPARVYPVKVDPDLGNGDTLDTYLSEGLPTQSFGSSADLFCGRMNSDAGKCRTLVQFPQVVTDIPVGSRATSAAFRLRQYWQPTPHSDSVYVSQLAEGSWWTESSTYSGANGRMATDYNFPVETVSGTGVWMVVSCASVVNDWITYHRTSGNNGFIVYEPDASGSGYSRKFRSHEYTGTDYDPNINVDYTIPNVTVTAPSASAVVYQGKTQSISWTMPSGFSSGYFKVAVVDGSGNATTLASSVAATGATSYSYNWSVAQAAGSWKARVTYYTAANDQADSDDGDYFSVYNATPTVTSPNGGESWLRGAVHPITWTMPGSLPAGGHFEVAYLYPGGATYTIDGNVPSTQRSCPWTILMTPSSGWKARVRYYDASQGLIASDESNASFTIADCSPSLTSPDGGENLYLGETYNINWTAPALTYGHFSVEIIDSGGAATTVDGSVAPNGTTSYSLPWTVDCAVGRGWKVKVTYYNAADMLIGFDQSQTGFAVLPDNEEQHTTTDLGSWDGHSLGCRLDDAKLTASVSDLAIASLGPAAEVSRSFRTGAATTRYAPGWFFSFDQHLDLSHAADALGKITYTDADNVGHDFYRPDAGGPWVAPNGLVATLSQNPDGTWKLLFDQGQDYLTFSSSGVLLKETAASGLFVTYEWDTNSLTMRAANGQEIDVSFSSGAVTGATYQTNAGTRTVAYSGSGSTWSVAYNAADTGANGTARTVAYTYASGLLTQVTQQDWPASGSSATLAVAYDGSGKVSEVRYPDYDASQHPDARATISYDSATQATVRRYGTVAGTANQEMNRRVYTWTGASAEVPGQLTSVTEGTGDDQTTMNYEYADDLQVEEVRTLDVGDDVLALGEADVDGDVLEGTHDVAAVTTATEVDQQSGAVTEAQHTDYVYDSQHRVTSKTTYRDYNPATGEGAQATTTLYSYDTYGNVSEEQVRNGDASGDVTSDVQYTYDSSGRLTCEKHWVAGSDWTETQYSNFAASGEPQTTVAKAIQLSYGAAAQDLSKSASYDAFGNLLSATDWGGRTTETNAYDLAGRKLTSTDASGVVTHVAYDRMGNAVETYRTASGTSMKADWSASTYDAMGRLLTVTTKLSDGSGAPTVQSVVTNVYDGAGNQLTSSDSTVGGEDEKWLYDEQGNVTGHWEMGVAAYDEARATRTKYDAQNRVVGESEPGNDVAAGLAGSAITGYDLTGRTASEARPDGSSTTYAYDDEGNQTTAESSVTGTLASTYGADGRLAAQTNERGFTTSSSYDGLGRATGATGSGQPETQTSYNHLGWVLRTIDANGVTSLKTYDAHGVLTDEAVGSAGTTQATYDSLNRLLTRTDPNGNLLTCSYDVFGNLHEEEHQDWNAVTLKCVVTDHDSLGRPTSENESVSGRSRSWAYPVNAAGGVQEALSYDAAPLTSTVVARNARGVETSRTTTVASAVTLTRSVVDSSGRDSADRWTSASQQLSGYGALTLGRSFDDAGRTATQSGAGFESGQSGSYAYHATSGLKTRQDLPLSLGGRIQDNYAYAGDGRLESWSVGPTATPTPMASYSYDAAGNLTGDGATTFAYSTSGTPNRLVSSTSGGVTTLYGWDQANAWRTSQGPTGDPDQIQYTYVKSGASTSNGRMTRYQDSATSTDASYAYDASGQRAKSAATVSGTTTTTNFTYDGLTLLRLSAVQGSSSWRIDYLYDEEGAVYGGVYRSPATQASPTVFTMITNDHGDVLELLDANGAAFAAYRYDPWGKPVGSGNYATGVWTQATSLITSTLAGQIASRQILRYASYAYDAESGLYYCSARYYDPATRQWTTGDPVKADGEESAFQYCTGDPMGKTDEAGLKPAVPQVVRTWKKYRNTAMWDGWATVFGVHFSRETGIKVGNALQHRGLGYFSSTVAGIVTAAAKAGGVWGLVGGGIALAGSEWFYQLGSKVKYYSTHERYEGRSGVTIRYQRFLAVTSLSRLAVDGHTFTFFWGVLP